MNGNGTVYWTPWGCLTLSEIYDLMMKANEQGDLEERDQIATYFDKCMETEALAAK